MRRRLVFAVVVPLVVVATLVGLRLTSGPEPEPTTAPTTGPVSWADSLRFAITPDRELRISTTRPDVCLRPSGGVQAGSLDALQVGLERGARDRCTGPGAGEPVDVALPADLDVSKATRVLVVSGLQTYPAFDVDNALYDSGVPA